MSRLRTSKSRKSGSPWQRLRDSLFSVESRGARERKPRRLRVDALEERTLLSVSPVNPTDTLVNQNTAAIQTTLAGQSVASDHNGDFVAVWTRQDTVLDSSGDVVLDPSTGAAMTSTDVYARYFTQDVQRITLPAGVLTGAGSGAYGHFSLLYGGNEVQEITFTQATPSLAGANYAVPISGTFSLWFDTNGNGVQDPGEVTAPINFDESSFDPANPSGGNALAMQTALRALGGTLADVTVTGTDADHYLINFGNASNMQVQPQLATVDAAWTTGFLPAAEVSVVSQPMQIGVTSTGAPNIPVSPTNPALTAAAIQQAFLSTTQTVLTAPTIGDEAPADYGPDTMTTSVQVIVTPVPTADDPNGLRTFDITFVGTNADNDLPAMVIPAGQVINAAKTPLNSTSLTAVIAKESSPEFRVNPENDSAANAFSIQPVQCSNPAVAMDADGDFVITWAAQVSDLANPGSDSDIFARRFEPVGMVSPSDPVLGPGIWQVDMNNDGVPDTPIQGVRPLQTPIPYNSLLPQDLQIPGDVYTFRVNTSTANPQDQPTVAMDNAGDFAITWASEGQDSSFFNSVYAQQFSHTGTPVGNEVVVSLTDTQMNYNPYVAMSQDGHWLVTWTNDTNATGHLVYARLFDSSGTTLLSMDTLGNPVEDIGIGEPTPTAAFDENNDFVISWTQSHDTDNIPSRNADGSAASPGVYFREYSLTGAILRSPDERANSGLWPNHTGGGQMIGLNPDASTAVWPWAQYGGQVVMDADGDLTVSYEGFGPDVAQTGNEGAGTTLINQILNEPQNADILTLWNEVGGFPTANDPLNSGDPDSMIEEVLIQAQYLGATDSQLGRLDAIMNEVLTLNRGEANGIMYAQFDADPSLGPSNVLEATTSSTTSATAPISDT